MTLRRKVKSLDALLQELQEFMAPKHNVHKDIKAKIVKARTEMAAIKNEVEKLEDQTLDEVPETVEIATQTYGKPHTDYMRQLRYPRDRHIVLNTDKGPMIPGMTAQGDRMITPSNKRRNRSVTPTGRPPDAKRSQQQQSSKKTSEGKAQNPGHAQKNQEWTQVERRKKSNEQRRGNKTVKTLRPRADAIVVEKTGEKSYADILRMLKSDPTLKEVGEKVARVKKTQKGHMLFELAKDVGTNREALQEKLQKVLDGTATVTGRTQQIHVVCKDIDDVTTKDELLTDLQRELQIDSIPESAVRSLRLAHDGTQTAVISLPFDQAKRALAAGKVKIGWTVCRIREATKPTTCFRCLEHGHLARDCKGEDRSKLCRKCGEPDHLARDCKKAPCCMVCSTENKKVPHVAGSTKCPKARSTTKAKA